MRGVNYLSLFTDVITGWSEELTRYSRQDEAGQV